MKGKEYLHKKFGYIKKLSLLILVVNLIYFNLKFGFNNPNMDMNTIYIVSMGMNILSASFILNHVKDLVKSVK
ncbi:hypothetical protein ABWH96_02990 [Marivirga tractuosa]|uniref:hypothetical protein n=1 Tax=Marivirga tractuosa TaxID=1006 RepID=UPI0035D06A41